MNTKTLTLMASCGALAWGCTEKHVTNVSKADAAGEDRLGVSVAPGEVQGTAIVNAFPLPNDAGAITEYSVTANPGGITARGSSLPLTVTGLTPGVRYEFTVKAHYEDGDTASMETGPLGFYGITETFCEPMTQPNDTIFTGTFTYDFAAGAVSNLTGSLTQAMTLVNGAYGSPMTSVWLGYQLSSVSAQLGGVSGLLVATFALPTTDTFAGGGFAPGATQYYGLQEGTANNYNAYSIVFVDTKNPTNSLEQAQIDKLAYADCTPGGLMGSTCMTGTTSAGYGHTGTMGGYPTSQVVTER